MLGNNRIQSTKKNFSKVLLFLCSFSFINMNGQSIWTNPITGTNPNTANPYTTGQTVDPSITVTGIGRGSGITGQNATDRYNASGWNSASFDSNDYFEFTLTPCVGGYINFVSFVYTGQVSSAGNPSSVVFRSSLDGFTSNIGTPNTGGTTISLSAAAYQGVTSSITFRLYGWGAGAPGNTWSINSFTFNGTASCTPPCTPPTTTLSATSQTLCTSTANSFSISSSASSPTYVWQMSANNSTWVSIANGSPTGATYGTSTLSTLTYTIGTASSTYYYRCLVTESGTCTATSNVNTVTVNAPVAITSGATDKGLCSGGNTTMDITGAAANKQWYVSTDNGATFNPVTVTAVYTGGITTNILSITNPPVSYNNNQYYCTVSVAGCPTLTSSIGVLTVTQTPSAPPTPTVLVNPACSGTALAAMTSTVAGVTWYWQGTNAAGTSTTNPTTLNDNVTASGTYYVRARTDGSSCLSANSSTVVTIYLPPVVTIQPVDKTQCVGTNTTFSVSATGTGLTYQWQLNTGSGFSNITANATYSDVTTAILSVSGITAGMNGYQYQCVINGLSPCTAVTSNFATLFITGAGAPTTPASSPATSAVACNAFNLSWVSGNGSNRLVVISTSPVVGLPVNGTSYIANSSFGSGGTIAAGEFVVYKGSSNSVFITGLNANTAYYYKIFEFNGCSVTYLSSGTIPNGNETTSICTNPPGATAVYVDACDGSCGFEGNNELIWGTTGSYGMSVANSGPSLNYNSSTPPSSTFISTYGSYPSNLAALNAAVGGTCASTTFIDPNTQGYIPPNSKFLIAHSCLCIPAAYDFASLCGNGPIYVVFGNNATWPCNGGGGIFGNSGSGIRYFDLNFSAWGVSLDPIYNFAPSSLIGGDGAYALFNPSGGAATTYSNSGAGCVVPIVILPIELVDFYAVQDGNKNDVIWKVASEKNILGYIIEKSEDGILFQEFSRLYVDNNEKHYKTYSVEDPNPNSEITYYRLSTIDHNGKINHHKIIDINRTNKNWEAILYQNDNNLVIEFKNSIPKNSTAELFDLSGKILADETIIESQTKINTQNFADGIYFLKISTPYKTQNHKVIIQNQ